jgi:toxin YoeB
MEIIFLPVALEHLAWFQNNHKKGQLKRVSLLLKDILNNPYEGIGKPEPLKFQLSGKWSRRIDKEHRLIYAILDEKVYVYALKGHY